jgi:hypothetical protein
MHLWHPDDSCTQNGIDLSHSIFHIGKGTSKRVNAHEQIAAKPDRIIAAYSLNSRKCDVIREICPANMQIKKEILFETDSQANALIYEWGMMYATGYSEHLTNGSRYHPGAGSFKYYPRQKGIRSSVPKDRKVECISATLDAIANVGSALSSVLSCTIKNCWFCSTGSQR